MHGIPAPQGDPAAPLQALIFDSQYDSYRGVVVYLRVMNGTMRPGMEVRMMGTGAVYKIVEVGYLSPRGMIAAPELGAGEVGYLTASIKTISDTRVGDTVTGLENPAAEALPGYKNRPAHGLLRRLSRRRLQIRRPAGRAGKAEAERRFHVL